MANDRIKQKDREWFVKDVGRGTFRLNTGKRVKPNEQFLAYKGEIPTAFRDSVHKLDGTDWNAEAAEEEQAVEQTVENQPQYYKQERLNNQGYGTGWYDVYDPNANPVDDSARREQQADELVQSLNEA